MAKDLKINPRIIEQLSKATIKNLIDGVVELVTNSDDSYKRIEERGLKTSGEIEIHVKRLKGGFCEFLRVKDYAEGMTDLELIKALEFAGETSGFEKVDLLEGFLVGGLKKL